MVVEVLAIHFGNKNHHRRILAMARQKELQVNERTAKIDTTIIDGTSVSSRSLRFPSTPIEESRKDGKFQKTGNIVGYRVSLSTVGASDRAIFDVRYEPLSLRSG